MTDSDKKKIVYLFGAGATHAEKVLACKLKGIEVDEDGISSKDGKSIGLLARHVSKRVVDQLLADKRNSKILLDRGINRDSLYNRGELGKEPYFDIELLISLLEAIKTEKSARHARILRRRFRQDILENIKLGKTIEPKLYSALIEWHNYNTKEELIGFLTLNYDSMIEKSFELVEEKFDYGFEIDSVVELPHEVGKRYLLKLHGSFNWYFDSNKNKIKISDKHKSDEMQWIPPGLNKDYLNYPYNMIHGKAYELLGRCQILRIVGCSLNQNDLGLISLLFRTQKSRQQNAYSIEIIDGPGKPQNFFQKLGMFLYFKNTFYESFFVKGSKFAPKNSFLDWLYFNIVNISKSDISDTKYLKHIEKWANL